MKTYVGTKVINAKPMNRKEYNDFRGWELPSDENGDDEGYLVEYVDGGQANTDSYSGYVSWSPKDVFEEAYKSSGEMNFGQALEILKRGFKVARQGWICGRERIFLVDVFDTGEGIKHQVRIDMKTATGEVVNWLAPEADVLAEDWMVVDLD